MLFRPDLSEREAKWRNKVSYLVTLESDVSSRYSSSEEWLSFTHIMPLTINTKEYEREIDLGGKRFTTSTEELNKIAIRQVNNDPV